MTSRTHISRAFVVASVVVSAVVVGGCGSTVGETGESAKSFGKAVGSSAKEAGLKVGDAFNKTFRTNKKNDERSAEIKKAEPTNSTTKKQ